MPRNSDSDDVGVARMMKQGISVMHGAVYGIRIYICEIRLIFRGAIFYIAVGV